MLALSWMMRTPILKGIGHLLIDEDKADTAEVMFVLGGSSYDRGNEAAALYNKGYAQKIVCTGGNIPKLLLALPVEDYTEAEITAIDLYRNGIDSGSVEILPKSTSTFEECTAIVNYCRNNHIFKAIVVTDKFHTNRVRNIIDQLNGDSTVTFLILGAASSVYDEEMWWQSEEGLIMVNNEFVKTVYYFFKY